MAEGLRIATSRAPLESASQLLAEAVARADQTRGYARLAIPGGSALAALGPARARLAPGVWSRVRLTWIDERLVPFASPESNRGLALRSGALDPRAPPTRLLPLYLDGERAEEARARVDAALRADFESELDVLLLGLGEDGHIASLFPGHPVLRQGGHVATVSDSPKPPAERITLTLPLLSTARTAIALALGEAKREAIQKLAAGEESLPAAALHGLVVVTDLELGGSR